MKLLVIGSGGREHALVWKLAPWQGVTNPFRVVIVLFVLLLNCSFAPGQSASTSTGLRVGAAGVELEADDSMVIAGGIHAGKASGQEGKLRCVAGCNTKIQEQDAKDDDNAKWIWNALPWRQFPNQRVFASA